ncbi:hypothetical protein BKA69DRAFT_1045136 [Paraphysoderma sedebokerense]|nr:hypothetical protein BKA69DRAFT_1045136 [Paraphysoderma sedebokerense]
MTSLPTLLQSYATKVSSANAGTTPAPGLGPISNSNVMNGLSSISSGSSFSSQNLASIQSPPPSSSSTLLSGPNANVQDSTLPPSDKHGLLGLLSVIRMTDPDMNALALGTDLTTLGLNLNSPDALYATFTTPFSDNPHHSFTGAPIEPEYHLPSCYYVQLPPPTAQKIGSFSDETLFYMFYALPRDALQEAAAQELYNRSWRYHKELKLWLTKDPSAETVLKTNASERSTFIFFDVANWEKVKKEYTLVYDALEERPSGVPSGSALGSAPGGVVGVNPTTSTTGNVIGSNIGGNVLGGGLGLGGLGGLGGGLGGIGLPVSNNVGSLQMLQQQQQLHHQFASGLQTGGVGGVTGLGL